MKNIIKNTNKKGFTIVELVIVIAVIAILAGVLIPTFTSIITKAHESAALQEAQTVYKEIYAVDISDGELDAQFGVTDVIVNNDSNATKANLEAENITCKGTVNSYDPNSDETKFSYTASNGKTVTLTLVEGVETWGPSTPGGENQEGENPENEDPENEDPA